MSVDYDWLQPAPYSEQFCYQHQVKFTDEVKWKAHLQECIGLFRKEFMCTCISDNNLCKREFKSASELIYHVCIDHKLFLCDRCNTKHDTMDQLHAHEHTHRRSIFAPIRCIHCMENCVDMTRYKVHFHTRHNELMPRSKKIRGPKIGVKDKSKKKKGSEKKSKKSGGIKKQRKGAGLVVRRSPRIQSIAVSDVKIGRSVKEIKKKSVEKTSKTRKIVVAKNKYPEILVTTSTIVADGGSSGKASIDSMNRGQRIGQSESHGTLSVESANSVDLGEIAPNMVANIGDQRPYGTNCSNSMANYLPPQNQYVENFNSNYYGPYGAYLGGFTDVNAYNERSVRDFFIDNCTDRNYQNL